MNKEEGSGSFGKITTIISLVISAIMTFVAVTTRHDNLRLDVEIEKIKHQLEQQIDLKKKALEDERKLYQESLRKYAKTYRELLQAVSREISKYREFLVWGPPEFGDRFPAERAIRFNNVMGRMDAVIDHVYRYRHILEPFSRSLNGRIERLRDDLAANDEQAILRSFEALEGGATSQIEALEEELKALSGRK